MADNKEYRLAIKIAGAVEKSLSDATGKTKKELRALAKEAALSQLKIDESFNGAMKTLSGPVDKAWDGSVKAVKATAAAVTAAAAAAAAAGAVVINVGSEFESAFAGVKKTVDATDEQLSRLEGDIRQMAKDKPQTAAELSEIAEAAGQLGIETDNIAAFTSTVADLKEATNLGDEGASQMAQFANITGMSQDKFSNLGSTIVDLGNHMATTEQDIMSMGMRLAGAGAQLGMTEADILGFSAALSSVGIEAEAGGSALSKTMINMQLAVEKGAEPWAQLQTVADQTGRSLADVINTVTVGGKGLKTLAQQTGMETTELKKMKKSADESQAELESYAEVAGMASDEFAELFKNSPAEALSAFISGIGNVEQNGKSAIMVLDDMGITEVRQRDALLRAANASDLFAGALEMANTAFEENTALTKEASQRYATFESRLGMVKNRITDVGITLYQDFREPLNEALAVALDFTDELELFDARTIEKVADAAKKAVPTMTRELKQGAEQLKEFSEPLFTLGEWAVGHADVLLGGLTAAGTTVGLLKTAEGIHGIATALNAAKLAAAANPVIGVVVATAAAGGAIAGLAVRAKAAREQLKKANLDGHFGDIALSVDELRDASKKIIGEGSIENLSKAMEELGKVSDIADDIKSAADTIDRMTWKVGMDLELTETDQSEFDSAITSMIDNSIDLVEQARYTAHVNVTALFGPESETGAELIDGFDSMYSGIESQVKDLGTQLGEAYNTAMEDGIISTDEARLIQELQAQLGEITSEVSQSQFDAKMERIRRKYSGKDLDADTFQNLQEEMQEQLTEASASLDQSYDYSLGALNLRLERSQSGEISADDAAYLTQGAYDKLKAELDAQSDMQQMEIQMKGVHFTTSSIMDAYDDELEGIKDNLQTGFDEAMGSAINAMETGGNAALAWDPETIQGMLGLKELDRSTRDAISQLWENMEPAYLELQEKATVYQESGMAIPENIAEGLRNASAIGAIAGSQEAIWQMMAFEAADSPQYMEALRKARDAGYELPDAVAAAILENKAPAEAAEESFKETEKAVQDTYAEGIDAETEIRVDAVSGAAAKAAEQSFREAEKTVQGVYGQGIDAKTEIRPELESGQVQTAIQEQNGIFQKYFSNVLKNGITVQGKTNLELDETDVEPAIDQVHDHAESYISDLFAGGFDASTELWLKVTPQITGLENVGTTIKQQVESQGAAGVTVTGRKLARHADGGIFTQPHVAWFAEAGYPEAAIPIDGSRNAVELWERTGEMLGLFGTTSTAGTQTNGHAGGGLMAPQGAAYPGHIPTVIYGDSYSYDSSDPYDDYDDEDDWEDYDGPGGGYGEFGRYGEDVDSGYLAADGYEDHIAGYDDIAFAAAAMAAAMKAQQPETVTAGGTLVTGQAEETQGTTYTVQKGDSLYKIAQKYSTTAAALYEANQGVIEATAKQHGKSSSDHGSWIWPGEQLQILTGVTTSGEGVAPVQPEGAQVTELSAVDAAVTAQEGTGGAEQTGAVGSSGQPGYQGALAAPQLDLKGIMDSLLRMFGASAQPSAGPASGMNVTYSPVYNLESGDAETIREADRRSRAEFETFMRDLQKDQMRVSFAG